MNKKIIGIPSYNNYIYIKYLIKYLTDYEIIEALPVEDQINVIDKYCSKFTCSSLKKILTSNIEALDNNAEILINLNNQCNRDLFFEYQREILKNLNYNYKIYILNKNSIKEIYTILKKLNPKIKKLKFLYYYILSKLITKFICSFEIYIKKNIGFEIKKGSFERIKKSFVSNFYHTENFIDLFKYYFKYNKKIKNVLLDKPKTIKKIYMLDNSYRCSDDYYIEKELALLNINIEYYKSSEYFSSNKKFKNKFMRKKIKNICKYPLGNDYKIIKDILKRNFDAFIFVKPYNCSLEISKIKILEKICLIKEIPFMVLTIDNNYDYNEIRTRLYALNDMIKINKKTGLK